MCLIALAWRMRADLPLVVAANRDEFYDRPTRAAHAWDDAPHVIGGRDLRAGGSWLAASRGGRLPQLSDTERIIRSAGAKLNRPGAG